MPTKTCAVKVKATAADDDTLQEGQFTALASVFNNIDAVGDVVVPGAFADDLKSWQESGDPIPVLWGHQMNDPNMNIGQVLHAEENDTGLQVTAQLDLDNPMAKQVYRLLKGRRVGKMSFAYDIEDGAPAARDGKDVYELRKLKLHEVSVVQIPANPAATVQQVKEAADRARAAVRVKKAISPHDTNTSTSEWDAGANEARLSNDAGAGVYRQAYAWVDPEADPDTKAAYKFPHHDISESGEVGPANMSACSAVIAALNGARDGADIPDDDRQGVWDHIAKHMRDADQEPPELKTRAAGGVKAGRTISAKNEATLRSALDRMTGAIKDVKSILDALNTDDGKASPTEPATAEEPDGAKTDQPATPGTASLRLLTDLDLLRIDFSDE